MAKKILIAAGGTGGHVIPAMAVTEELVAAGCTVLFMTDKPGHGIFEKVDNNDLLKNPSFQVIRLKTHHFSGNFLSKLLALAGFAADAFLVLWHVVQKQPSVAIGLGGYMAFWPLFYANLFRKPCFLYAADAVLGRTNQALVHFATKIWLGFSNTKGLSAATQKKATYLGIIIRDSFKKAVFHKRQATEPLRLLVLGGSQGASIFGKIIPQAIKLLPPAAQALLDITQQCHPSTLKETQNAYQKIGAQVRTTTFIKDVVSAIQNAHFVITRSGASAIGEISAIGRPALLVPYPFASRDHQTANAHAAESLFGFTACAQRDLTPRFVADLLAGYIQNPKDLEKAAQAACGKEAKENTLDLAIADILRILRGYAGL